MLYICIMLPENIAGTHGSREGQGHTHVRTLDSGRMHQDGSGNWAISIRTKNDHNLQP